MKKLKTTISILAVSFAMFLSVSETQAQTQTPVDTKGTKPTVIFVHGAFADGSSWQRVISILQDKGLNVVAVQLPLTALADDVATVKRAIANQAAPIVLVGHSWGGTVITEAGNDDKVSALVYVAAFAPAEGQSTADLIAKFPEPSGSAHIKPDAAGFASLTLEGMQNHFAQDLPKSVTRVMAATQGPINTKSFGDKITKPAWRSKPSWFVLTQNDHMIQPDLQEAEVKTINAKATRVKSSHVPMLVKSKEVATVIQSAVNSKTETKRIE